VTLDYSYNTEVRPEPASVAQQGYVPVHIDTIQKDVHTMAAISNTENDVHTAQKKVKKQQLTLTDTWKKLTGL